MVFNTFSANDSILGHTHTVPWVRISAIHNDIDLSVKQAVLYNIACIAKQLTLLKSS